MPNWSQTLPDPAQHKGYDLVRTPPDRPLRAVITCEQMAICFTHFWGGRTRPCEKPECEACNAMSPTRAHCYVSAYDPGTKDHFLFECTAAAAFPFRDWIATYGTLRGCMFHASRPKRRRNSKVEILTKPCDLTKIVLPNPPDVPLAMTVIWQIPGTAIKPHGAIDGTAAIAPSRDIIDHMRLNPADLAHSGSCAKGNGSP